MRPLLILIAVIALVFISRYFYRRSPSDFKKLGRYLAVGLGTGVFLLLLLTGRLHWMFAAIAAAIPLFFRLLPLIRYVPLLKNIYAKYQRRRAGPAGAAQSQSSSVRSRFILMTLNLDSGQINGNVVEGQFAGKGLKDLTSEQLFELLKECSSDSESVSLLTAYLDREHPGWREQARAGSSSEYASDNQGSGKMTVEEACEILGLTRDADDAQIREAHRKLISKLHPDHGGSTYLSAKINLAKDTLLKQK